jgi:O-antigen/teichoic acid export membrane protein
MGRIIKNSFWNVLISYSGILLGAVNTLILFQYYTAEEEFGLTRLFVSLASTAALVASGGLTSVIVRVYPRFSEKQQARSWFIKAFFGIPFILCAIICLGFYAFKGIIIANYADDSPLFALYAHWLPLLLVGSLTFSLLEGYARVQHKVVLSSVLRDIGTRIYTAIIIAFYALSYISFDAFMGLFCAQFVFLSIFLLWEVRKGIRYDIVVSLASDKNELSAFQQVWKEIHPFIWLNFASSSTNILIANIDNLMLAQYVDLGQIGVYNFGLYIATLVIIPFRILMKVTYPLLAEHLAKNELPKVHEIYQKGSTNMLWFGMLIFIGIWVNLPDMLSYVKPVYQNVQYIFLFLSIGHIFTLMLGLSGGILLSSPYYYFDSITSAILVGLLVLSNLWFIPTYGIEGAALATASSIGLYQVSRLIFVKLKYGVQPIGRGMLFIFAISFIIVLANQFLPLHFAGWLNVLIRSFAVTVVYLGLNILFKTSPEINQIIQKISQYKRAS